MKLVVNQSILNYLIHHGIFLSINEDQSSELGKEIYLEDNMKIEKYVGIFNGYTLCSIGSYSYSLSPLHPWLSVGRFCSIAGNVQFGTGDRHPIEQVTTSHLNYHGFCRVHLGAFEKQYNLVPNITGRTIANGPPKIGNDVWVGQDVQINDGVNIHDGAVIASKSVVTRDVRPYTIVGGNPAQYIRNRFSEEIISDLLTLKWWNYNLQDFHVNNFNFSDPYSFIQKLKESINLMSIYKPIYLDIEEIKSLV
jgi:acetyltransferase-like isoleucine patch superfamily enzyme